MKLTRFTNWIKRIPRPAVIGTAAFVLVLLIIVLPLLVRRIGGEDTPDRPDGVLRNPTVTYPVTDTDDTRQPQTPPAFLPMAGEFSLSVPMKTDTANSGQIFALPTSSAVLLSTKQSLSEDQISSLSVTPEVPITVTPSEDGYRIEPTAGAWEQDTLYRLRMDGEDGYLAAFQTHRAFVVESVYPAHEMTEVPTDTGIEITFSDTVRNTDLAAYISVTPPIDGRFEIYPNGKTVVIIPDEPLEKQSQYTVRVAAGMPSDHESTLGEDRIFGFFTMSKTSYQADADYVVSVPGDAVTSPEKETVLSYNAFVNGFPNYETNMNGVTFSAEIFAYPSADALAADLLTVLGERGKAVFSGTNALPTKGLERVWDGEVTHYTENARNSGESGWLYLPVMEEGVYLVCLHSETEMWGSTFEYDTQVLLQVTPLRAYTESTASDTAADTLFWVHRTDTGNAAVGADITVSAFENTVWTADGVTSVDGMTAVTDDDGLASVVTTGDTDAALVRIAHEGHTLLLGTQLAKDRTADTCRVYLYTDRRVYFPDDTVYFHGVLGRIYEGQALPETLSLSVAGNDTGVRIAVAEDGTFGGSFPIEDWMSTYLSFTLQDDTGVVSVHRNIEVTQQEKPLYQLTVTHDKPFYTYDDKWATVTMALTYFDGTPAPGVKLSVSDDYKTEHVTTDENGLAYFTYQMHDWDFGSTYPSSNGVSAQVSGYETASVYQYAGTMYFHSSGVMTTERIDRNQSRVTLHALDTSRIEKTADIYAYQGGYPTLVQGAPMNTAVTVTLEKTYYVKNGVYRTSYDPINKVTVEHYDYQQKTDIIKTYQADVVDGELILDHIDMAGENCSYRYIVAWKDPATGHTYREYVYANKSNRDYARYPENAERWELTADRNDALPGEAISLALTFGDNPAAVDGTRILYTRHTLAGGRTDVSAGSMDTYRYTFDEACAVGCMVNATVFDGEDYVTDLSHTAVYAVARGSTVDMEISSDRETYLPGEQAVITVNAPELAGGTVRISIVDEACFALGEQTVDPIAYFRIPGYRGWGSSLYRLPTVRRNARFSLRQLLQDTLSREQNGDILYDTPTAEEAEKDMVMEEAPTAPATGGNVGESKPAYIRENFLNTAAFVTVTLDENGTGAARVTVPDNITTWRMTAIGFAGTGAAGGKDVTSGVRCGTAVSDTVCTLPLFLNITMPDLFLSRDEITFSARTAGTVRSDNPTAPVSYTAVLYDETGAELAAETASATANGTAWFSFGTLACGEYSVVVTGVCGEYSDAVRSSFRVVETAQIAQVQKLITPAELADLNPAAFPLTLTFFDGTDTLYYETLSRVAHNGYRRNDARAAAYAALTAEEALFGDSRPWYAPRSMADDIRREISNNSWGFLPLNDYGEGDPILTAKVLFASPDVLTPERRSQLIPEYEAILEQHLSGEQAASALMALACLDRPVLDLLYEAAQYVDNMSDYEVLYLAAAFAAIGDSGAARALWEPLRDEWGQEEDGGAFCIVGADTETTISLTALALLPTSIIDRETACAMVRYLDNHTSSVDLHLLELAAFITHYQPTASAETQLLLRTRVGDEEITLARGERYTVTLTASDFRAFAVVSADDGIAVRAAYGASPADAMYEKDSTLTVHKTITPYDAENGIYRVTLTFEGTSDADDLIYTVTDTIPAGARYFIADRTGYHDNNCYVYLYNNGGQQVKGHLSCRNPTLHDKYPLDGTQPYTFSASESYLIRGAVKGTFTAEPTLVLNEERGTYAVSEEITVTIDDGAWEIK